MIFLTPFLPFVLNAKISQAPVQAVPVPIVAASKFADSTTARPMREWLAALRQNEPAQTPACHWRMLVLIYPNMDSDYKEADGRITHHSAHAEPTLIQAVKTNIAELPVVVRQISGGACDLQLDVHIIERNLTLNRNGQGVPGNSFPGPEEADEKPETDRFNKPVVYDSVAVFFNPGDLPQSLAGAGGGGRGGTHFVGNLGDMKRWTKSNDYVGGTMSWGQGLVIHEWTHGLDGFYTGNGYLLKYLHHLYRYGRVGLDDKEMFIAYHQGLLTYLDSSRFGYTRSVWLSGSPRHPVDLLPCQLTSPTSGTVLGFEGIELKWVKTPAPDGYVVTIKPDEKENGEPIEIRTSDERITIPKDRLKLGSYRWYAQALKGDLRSAIGDTLSFKVEEPAKLSPPMMHAVALDQPTAAGGGNMVRFWARLSSPAGIRVAYVDYEGLDGSHERVRLQRRSGWSTDNRWTGLIWIVPNGDGRVRNLSLKLHVEDNAGKTIDSQPIPLEVAPQLPNAIITASHRWRLDSIEAVNDGLIPSHSGDQAVPRFTWFEHRGSQEWMDFEYRSPQTVDAFQVYWFQDAPNGGCQVPEAWRLLYRQDRNAPWMEVRPRSLYETAKDSWNTLRFNLVTAAQFRLEVKLKPGFSAGILEGRLMSLAAGAPRTVNENTLLPPVKAEFNVVSQNWRDGNAPVYAPFSDFDFLQVRVHLPKGPLGETDVYDGRVWADIKWANGQTQHLALEGSNQADGSELGKLGELYGVATAWVARIQGLQLDYDVQFHYRHSDGSLSNSSIYHRVFVPALVRRISSEAHYSASHSQNSDPVKAIDDDALPANSNDQRIPRFTWWDHKGTTEWVQLSYDTPQTMDSSYAYWFQDTPNGGCKVPDSWRLLYRDAESSPWKEVKAKGPYGTDVDQWSILHFAPVTAKQFRIEAKLKSGFSAGILEWSLSNSGQ